MFVFAGQVPNLWRLHMSLKCGLLAESTRALELLSILTCDDHTLGLFMLPQQPTILETVLCHFIACLRDTFGDDIVSADGIPPASTLSSLRADMAESDDGELGESEDVSSNAEHQSDTGLLKEKSMLFDTEHVFTHLQADGTVLGRLSNCQLTSMASGTDCVTDSVTDSPVCALTTEVQCTPEDLATPGQRAFSCEESDTCTGAEGTRHGPSADASYRRGCDFPRSWLRHSTVCEPEPYPLISRSFSQVGLAQRCQALSNILRSFSFLPQNERHMARHDGLIDVISSILLFHQVGRDESVSGRESSQRSQEQLVTAWWWSCLEIVRADLMVLLVNVSGQIDIACLPESVAQSLTRALVHWCISSCSAARDSLPSATCAPGLALQRLALEALGKISIGLGNSESMLALLQPSEWQKLCGRLMQWLLQKRHNVQHELALVLLSGLASVHTPLVLHLCDEHVCVISLMLQLLTETDANLRALASGLAPNDSYTGTSLDILRRAAVLLLALAKERQNRIHFQLHQEQLLFLAASSCLDTSVTGLVADILFQLTLD